MFQCFFFFLIFAFFCHSFSSLPLLLDIFTPKNGPPSGVRGTFLSHQRLSGFPETGADLWGGSGNFRGIQGKFQKTSKSTVSGVSGKSPREVRVNFWKSRDFREARGNLTAKSVSKVISGKKGAHRRHGQNESKTTQCRKQFIL